ncbi:MAG: nitrous oxide reductase accessory protein NosL [Flavobacteriales bacterium]|nr:nitrous oxide reductase accessory protein NosL [Flavobacteriales bacterium]
MTVPHPRPFSRIVIGACALAIISLLYVPIWRIDLAAPQYPEGLALQIFHDRFTGDVQKINGLNHYIGMATIENDMFPEFTIMRYAFCLLAGWGLVAAMIGRRGAFFSWIMALFAYVIWAMWDMYAWGYKYGHDLDPHAAIKVEGMAYQPPLFGHKKLLNFDAWSLPDTGGWILFAVITLACIVWFVEWRWPRKEPTMAAKPSPALVPAMALVLLLAPMFMAGCGSTGAPVVDIGKAECAYCRMNVMDAQFASAILTQGGRTYAFDSPECMVQHVADGNIAEGQVKGWWVCDHAHAGTFIDATSAFYLRSPTLKSPMNGNTAAFGSEADRAVATKDHPGEALDWAAARALLTDH